MTEPDDTVPPLEVGTLVDYRGSHGAAYGPYRIEKVDTPVQLPGVTDEEFAEAYPEGIAYMLWPEGVPHKWGLRYLSIVNVRPSSVTAVGS